MEDFVAYRAAMNPQEVAHRLVDVLTERLVQVYAVVDHQKDMAERGVQDPPWAYTVIFGNPVLGAQFLRKSPRAVADMPIRLGIYGDEDQSVVYYRTMASLLSQHHPDLASLGQTADQLVAQVLREIGAAPVT
jgi:uncharacterized protein (DUF302 family)